MTNKPMLSVELRSLLEKISNGAYCKPDVMEELRALLDKPEKTVPDFEMVTMEDLDGARLQRDHQRTRADRLQIELGKLKDNKHQGKPVAWASPKAIEALKEVGWMHVGAIGGDTAVPLFLHSYNTAPVVTVANLIQAIHEVEGFPGVTGYQLLELADRLNGS